MMFLKEMMWTPWYIPGTRWQFLRLVTTAATAAAEAGQGSVSLAPDLSFLYSSTVEYRFAVRATRSLLCFAVGCCLLLVCDV